MKGMPQIDYDRAPFVLIWEATQACDLTCQHCRAAAQPNHHPGELTTQEGEKLLSQAAELGTPIFILSGGDPLKRNDLFHLIRYGSELKMRMATIPAATDLLTEGVVRQLKESGLSQIAQSIDFPRAELHDRFRGVPGAFAKSMQAIQWARHCNMPAQINTTLCAQSAPYLEEMVALIQQLGIVFWEVFFLVPMGRGADLGRLTAVQCEEIFALLYRVQKSSRFLVKVTEAPHYRRYVTQCEMEEKEAGRRPQAPVRDLPRQLMRTEGPGHSIGLATRGVNSGNGFAFISHTGEVYPSGFLPVSAGNIRDQSLAHLYQHSELFQQLRRPWDFKGVCGLCEFNNICGGSRSRAYAITGDYLASDPWCVYQPAAKNREVADPPRS